jgi:uncharacterized protein YdbL (DUF1318 family)
VTGSTHPMNCPRALARDLRVLRGAALLLLTWGCVSAKINVVDERTALENQILGQYEELDRELLLVASVRAAPTPASATPTGEVAGPGLPAISRLRDEALRARQTQQFNRDDLDELKGKGCLGEGGDGLLAPRDCEAAGGPAVAERIARLVETENQARRSILRYVLASSPDLTEQDLPKLTAAWSRLAREQARPGEWIQDPAGEWKHK